MNKSMTVVLVVTFAVVLSFVLGTALPAQAGGWHGRWWHHRPTVLDKLEDTDGAQALVAAVKVVDESESEVCPQIGELLDDRRASLTVFAPDNTAFEKLLKLPPGALDGLSVGNIVGILESLTVDPDALCEDLLKHVSVEGRQSKRDLLREGEIIEEGDHKSLMTSGGHYAELYNTYFRHQSPDYSPAQGKMGYVEVTIDQSSDDQL